MSKPTGAESLPRRRQAPGDSGNASTRVLVLSPRQLIRAGLVALLQGQPQIQVMGDAASLDAAAALDCDVILWDAALKHALPMRVPWLVLLPAPDDAQRWLAAGATGCILETASLEQLLSALRQVARGETFLSPAIVERIVAAVADTTKPRGEEIERLTEREREVLQLLAQGLSNKDMAQKLYLSVRTVEGHLANIYGKLHLKTRTEAVVWAVQNL